MIFVIIFQSIGEEIFFRGFLLEKIESKAGINMAILITAVFFGLAHMSYGKIYPTIMPIIMGIILGVIVSKTKNLTAAIVCHMLFNFISFVMYLFVQSYNIQALIL
jgi:membrane protease YdiL (CAAX protease family)